MKLKIGDIVRPDYPNYHPLYKKYWRISSIFYSGGIMMCNLENNNNERSEYPSRWLIKIIKPNYLNE